MYGQDKLGAPSYDLALLAPQVLGIAAREVSLSPEQPSNTAEMNPAVSALISPRVFWGVLIVAAISLLALLARLLKSLQSRRNTPAVQNDSTTSSTCGHTSGSDVSIGAIRRRICARTSVWPRQLPPLACAF